MKGSSPGYLARIPALREDMTKAVTLYGMRGDGLG